MAKKASKPKKKPVVGKLTVKQKANAKSLGLNTKFLLWKG